VELQTLSRARWLASYLSA